MQLIHKNNEKEKKIIGCPTYLVDFNSYLAAIIKKLAYLLNKTKPLPIVYALWAKAKQY